MNVEIKKTNRMLQMVRMIAIAMELAVSVSRLTVYSKPTDTDCMQFSLRHIYRVSTYHTVHTILS